MNKRGGWGRSGDAHGNKGRRTRRDSLTGRPPQTDNPWERAQTSRGSVTANVVVPEPFTNGRHLAYAVLQEYDRSDRFVQDIFAEFESRHRLSAQDRALAVDVASGVVRRSRTLDVMLESRMTRPRHNVEPDLWRVLRLGAFQLLFARTPEHAAVDSAVDLCRDLNRDRWTGFVNGVLRNVGRLLSESECAGPSPRSLPTVSGSWRTLEEAVFADPATDLSGYVADAFSLPVFLASRWCRRFQGESLDALWTICFQSVSPPSTTLRVNATKTTAAEVYTLLSEAGYRISHGNMGGCLRLDQSVRLDTLPGYAEGQWSVQDEAAMSASVMLAPQPGEFILDMCAAPGGKTTHMAELSGDRAQIIACDVATGRLRRVLDNAARLQLTSITPQLIGKDGNSLPDGPFDAVLVDVPCSNTGVLNRRPEARWRCDEKSLRELVILQTRLLLQACERVRPGGRVVYSTCSLEPEENRGVVDAVLSAMTEFQLIEERLHLPGLPADGAYQALLRRAG